MTNRPGNVVQQIKKATRKRFSADEKIRIALEGLRGQVPISELCRKEGISAAAYHKWAKDCLEAGENGLTLQTRCSATSEEVKQLRGQNEGLKQALAEATPERLSLDQPGIWHLSGSQRVGTHLGLALSSTD